jgi:hypothetical protein
VQTLLHLTGPNKATEIYKSTLHSLLFPTGFSQPAILEGLKAKLGPLQERRIEPGGGYYVAYVEYLADCAPLYRERMLVRLASPLSRGREVPEALYREAEVPWRRSGAR